MVHDRTITGREGPVAIPSLFTARDMGRRKRGRSWPGNLASAAQIKQTNPIEFTSDNEAPSGSLSPRATSKIQYGFRLKITKFAKAVERYTGPPGPFALSLFCAFSIWLSYRSNELSQQALIESRKQTALAEWSATLELIQYCNTLPPWNTSTIRLCDSTFGLELRPPPVLAQRDRPRYLDAFFSWTRPSHQMLAPPAPELCGGGSLRRRYCNDQTEETQHDELDGGGVQYNWTLFEQPGSIDVNEECHLCIAPLRVGVGLGSTIYFPTFESWSDRLDLNSQTQRTGPQVFQLDSFPVCLFAAVCALIVLFEKRYEIWWWKAKLD